MGLTEEQLSSTFAGVVNTPLWFERYPAFAYAREIECQQGRPDFVGARSGIKCDIGELQAFGDVLATPSMARVLSLLKPYAPRTLEHILRCSGLSNPVVRRSLDHLEDLNLIHEASGSGYLLSNGLLHSMVPELWAFEIKLQNWQRALYQALQYRAFAHRAVVVLAAPWAHRVEKHIERFRALNIGVMTLDPITGDFRTIITPRKQRPGSRFHFLYALGKFLQRHFPVS